jgi:polysaccharide biosynthesis protein PslH
MKILVIGNRIPVKAKDGGALATKQMLQILAENGNSVDFVSLNTLKHFASDQDIQTELHFLNKVKYCTTDTSLKPFAALKNLLFSSKSYNLERFYSQDFLSLILGELKTQKYDIVQFEGLFSTPYIQEIKKVCNSKLVVRTHNIETNIWSLMASQQKNKFKRWYLGKMAKRLRQEELKLYQFADGFMHISDTDKQFFEEKFPKSIHTLVGYGVNPTPHNEIEKIENSVCHIGSMEWQPNVEGLQWFLKEVWPLVLSNEKDAKMYIAGKAMPEEFTRGSWPNVWVLGEVENASDFMQQHEILVVPLHSASGIRIKTIEAVSLGICVVTTPVGAQGLPLQHGKEIWIENNAQKFADAIVTLLQNKQKAKQIAFQGKIRAEAEFTLHSISAKIQSFYQLLLS